MSIHTPNTAAPALPADLEALLRQLKMPHARGIAAEVLATARAQRWEPAEVLKALLVVMALMVSMVLTGKMVLMALPLFSLLALL